jgi:type III secretory pathway component EscT
MTFAEVVAVPFWTNGGLASVVAEPNQIHSDVPVP